jgi:hypothetical protein
MKGDTGGGSPAPSMLLTPEKLKEREGANFPSSHNILKDSSPLEFPAGNDIVPLILRGAETARIHETPSSYIEEEGQGRRILNT